MNRRLGCWGVFGIGRRHVRSLACQADRPEDHFDREKSTADGEPVCKISDLVSIRLQHRPDPAADGAVGLGDIVDALVIARREKGLASEREHEPVRQQHIDRGAYTRDKRDKARTLQTSKAPWLTFVPRKEPETDAAASTVPARLRRPATACSCSRSASAVSW